MRYHMDGDWRNRAKCLGDDPAKWEIANRQNTGSAYLQNRARVLCEGCPVARECARSAQVCADVLTIRAGCVLTSSPERNRAMLELVVQHGLRAPSSDVKNALTPARIAAWEGARCSLCDGNMRPSGVTHSEMPGTILGHSKTLCRACYDKSTVEDRETAAAERDKRKHERWANRECRLCGVYMRPRNEIESHWPGTVEIHTDDRCRKCARKERDEEKRVKFLAVQREAWEGSTCKHCGRQLRPRGVKNTESFPDDWVPSATTTTKDECHQCHWNKKDLAG